jgi:hypothetical protein
LAALRDVNHTGKQSFSEGMARVLAVGGRLTVPQLDLLRAVCAVTDCPVPDLPPDLEFDAHAALIVAPKAEAPAQANAR